MIKLNGVHNSCDIVARKADFSRSVAWACSVTARNSSFVVRGAQLRFRASQGEESTVNDHPRHAGQREHQQAVHRHDDKILANGGIGAVLVNAQAYVLHLFHFGDGPADLVMQLFALARCDSRPSRLEAFVALQLDNRLQAPDRGGHQPFEVRQPALPVQLTDQPPQVAELVV